MGILKKQYFLLGALFSSVNILLSASLSQKCTGFCFLPVPINSDYLLCVFFPPEFQISSSDAPLQPLVSSPSLQAAVEKNKLEVW